MVRGQIRLPHDIGEHTCIPTVNHECQMLCMSLRLSSFGVLLFKRCDREVERIPSKTIYYYYNFIIYENAYARQES